MGTEYESGPPHCPTCGRALECLGNHDISAGEVESGRAHVYWCPGGCSGPQVNGTFEFVECPVCESHDTASGPRADGLEEIVCNSCGAISRVHCVT